MPRSVTTASSTRTASSPLQALADFDGQAFPGVVVHHCQRAQPPAIEQGIGYNVHAPDFVDGRDDALGLA